LVGAISGASVFEFFVAGIIVNKLNNLFFKNIFYFFII